MKKKHVILFLMITIIISMETIVNAAASFSMKLEAAPISAKIGDTIQVAVKTNNVQIEEYTGSNAMEYVITYDNSKLSYEGSSYKNNWSKITEDTSTAGEIGYVMINSGYMASSEEIMVITFKIKAGTEGENIEIGIKDISAGFLKDSNVTDSIEVQAEATNTTVAISKTESQEKPETDKPENQEKPETDKPESEEKPKTDDGQKTDNTQIKGEGEDKTIINKISKLPNTGIRFYSIISALIIVLIVNGIIYYKKYKKLNI